MESKPADWSKIQARDANPSPWGTPNAAPKATRDENEPQPRRAHGGALAANGAASAAVNARVATVRRGASDPTAPAPAPFPVPAPAPAPAPARFGRDTGSGS